MCRVETMAAVYNTTFDGYDHGKTSHRERLEDLVDAYKSLPVTTSVIIFCLVTAGTAQDGRGIPAGMSKPPGSAPVIRPPFGFAPGVGGNFAPPPFMPMAGQIPGQGTNGPVTSDWSEHNAPDGRKYFYNRRTKQSTWEKPDDLKTPSERIMAKCPWKEFKTDSGRVYFYHSQTKQSVWTKPAELAEAEKQVTELESKERSQAPILPVGERSLPGTPSDSNSLPGVPGIGSTNAVTTTSTNGQPGKSSSAIEEAMKATLASIDLPPSEPPVSHVPSKVVSEESSEESSDEEDSPDTNNRNGPSAPPHGPQELRTKAEKIEAFKELLRIRNVPANASWDQAVRLISGDKRYPILKTLSEKKQLFNTYKTQKIKEEREEQRLKAKKAREDLEQFLLTTSRINSTVRYRKADSMLFDHPKWMAVSERDRRDIFEDVVQQLAKREKEEAKALRKRNMKVFNEILDTMPNLMYRTTWSEAQQMLLDNPRFAEDVDLQNMDKEDALQCFEEHIRMLEQEHDDEREQQRRVLRRQQRKNREAFSVFLDELHDMGKLTSLSLWKDLYIIISRDQRFHAMLSQSGSTPLDLFKFYVEDLKSRFQAEKKVVKEILKDRAFAVDATTSIDDFLHVINTDERGMTLDAGNVRMSFNNLVEKSEARERERQREEVRRLKRLESGFKEMLRDARDPPVDATSSWDAVRARFGNEPAFVSIPLESERMRVYKDYLVSLDEMCLHRHGKRKKKEKKKKRKRTNRSTSRSDSGVVGHAGGEDSVVDEQRSRASLKRARSGQSSSRERDHDGTPSPSPDRLAEGSAAGGSMDTDKKEKKKHKKTKKKKKRRTEGGRREQSEGEISDREGDRKPAVSGSTSHQSSLNATSQHQHHHHSYHNPAQTSKRRRNSYESDLSEGELQEQRRKLLEELDD